MNIQVTIISVLLQLTYYSLQAFGIPKCNAICDISWVSSIGWPDDDSLESKHVALSIILRNKLCLKHVCL